MFCFDCFSRDTPNEFPEAPNKKIHIKHPHTKHYTLLPSKTNPQTNQYTFFPHNYESIIFPWLTITAFEIQKIFSKHQPDANIFLLLIISLLFHYNKIVIIEQSIFIIKIYSVQIPLFQNKKMLYFCTFFIAIFVFYIL